MQVLPPESADCSLFWLDIKDKKILVVLLEDMRTPLSQIARRVGLSRQTVEYRINKLQEHRVIAGSRAVVNLNALGYHTYHFFLNAKTLAEEQEIIARAKQFDAVNVIISYTGRWSLELSIIARTPDEFIALSEALFSDFPVDVAGQMLLIRTIKSTVLPPAFLGQSFPLPRSKKTIAAAVDEKDLHLIEMLSDDATKPVALLAKQTTLSTDAVLYRLKKLCRSAHIIEFRPIVNYAALGLSIHTLLLKVSGSAAAIHKLELFLQESVATIWIAKAFGDWNYIIFIAAATMDAVHEFILLVKSRFSGILREYEALYAYKEHKYTYYSRAIRKDFSAKKS